MLHALRYIPAAIFAVLAIICFLASFAGDNTDARALAQIMLVPGVIFLLMAAVAALAGWAI